MYSMPCHDSLSYCRKMKCALRALCTSASFHRSRLSTWQSKTDGSCTLTMIHFSSRLPSSRASLNDSREMISVGRRYISARVFALDERSDAPPVAYERERARVSASAAVSCQTDAWVSRWLKIPGPDGSIRKNESAG